MIALGKHIACRRTEHRANRLSRQTGHEKKANRTEIPEEDDFASLRAVANVPSAAPRSRAVMVPQGARIKNPVRAIGPDRVHRLYGRTRRAVIGAGLRRGAPARGPSLWRAP